MNKFRTMFKKELKELITLQTVLPLVIMVIVFSFVGDFVGSEREKSEAGGYRLGIIDMDKTTESQKTLEMLNDMNVNIVAFDVEDITEIDYSTEENLKTVLIIPKGYGEKLKNLEQTKIEKYTVIKGVSLFSLGGDNYVFSLIRSVSNNFADEYLKKENIDKSPDELRNMVYVDSNVVMNKKTANISSDSLEGFILSQTLLVPVIIFFLMIMAIQMIITSIVSEKENKTLETLLSCPVSRVSIVTSKILAAGTLSLIFAFVYMIGMRNYLNGITGGTLSGADSIVTSAMDTLGIGISTTGYIVLGISLFLSIVIGLSGALILGAFIDDIKKAQGIVAPMIIMLLIPFVLSIFIDINSASTVVKVLVYIIPFSHSLMVSKNLIFQNTGIVVYGILYQLLVLIILILAAGRVFSTDKILTMKLGIQKRKKTAEE